MITGFSCAHCKGIFGWDDDAPLNDPENVEIKTIANRFCMGCIDEEAKVHGISRSAMIEYRRDLGERVP